MGLNEGLPIIRVWILPFRDLHPQEFAKGLPSVTWLKFEQILLWHDIADMLVVFEVALAAFLAIVVVAEDLEDQHNVPVPASTAKRIGILKNFPGRPGENLKEGFVH